MGLALNFRHHFNPHLDLFRLPFGALPLEDFDFRLARSVSRYEASVSAAVDNVLFAEVVLVEEAAAHARNADSKTAIELVLNLARFQCCMARIWFHDGSRPGIWNSTVSRKEGSGCIREKGFELGVCHVSIPRIFFRIWRRSLSFRACTLSSLDQSWCPS